MIKSPRTAYIFFITTFVVLYSGTKIMLVNGTVLDTSILQYIVRIRTDDGTTYGRSTKTLTVNVIVTPVLQPSNSLSI